MVCSESSVQKRMMDRIGVSLAYERLADLTPADDGLPVNVWGVVSSFKAGCNNSLANDKPQNFLHVDLLDEGVNGPRRPGGKGLLVSLFVGAQSADEARRLPPVSRGDVLRLQNVRVRRGRPVRLSGRISGANAPLHVLVFQGAETAPVVPLASSSKPDSAFGWGREEGDEDRLKQLRAFYAQWRRARFAAAKAAPLVQLADVLPRAYVNLLVQVVGISHWRKDCTVLRVWDGSTPPTDRVVERAAFEDADPDDPSQLVLQDDALVETVGNDMAVDVYAWDEWGRQAQQLHPGMPVRLRNVHVRAVVHNGEEKLCLSLHRGGVNHGRAIRRLIHDDDDDVLSAQFQQNLAEVTEERRCVLNKAFFTPAESLENAPPAKRVKSSQHDEAAATGDT